MPQLNALPKIEKPNNFPYVSFAKGTPQRQQLEEELAKIRGQKDTPTLPLWIGYPVYREKTASCVAPHDHKRILARYSVADKEDVEMAIITVLNARKKWVRLNWRLRLNIFQRAAHLAGTKYLIPGVAAVMEDYSKSPHEAFIDWAELIDFWNFNTHYASWIYGQQPESDGDTQNIIDWRPLEGFVAGIPPNNFVAINANLATAQLIMGNVSVVKPCEDVVYSFHLVLKILLEAGLPPDVLAVVNGDEEMIGNTLIDHEMLSGVHFTGSTDTFELIWQRVAQNIKKYRSYPRLVGETGGKNAIVVYDDHDPEQTARAIVVGGFGAQGRKCSATSRVYMTPEMWSRVATPLRKLMDQIRVGDVADFRNFMGALINEQEWLKVAGYLARAHIGEERGIRQIIGGYVDNSRGWFVYPTVVVLDNPNHELMREEVFGPVVAICLLPREKFVSGEVLKVCDKARQALTGAVHTSNIYIFEQVMQELLDTMGMFYDDRTAAAMVGMQPFSGGRKSGTNSKVGWWLNLLNWTSPRTICLRSAKTTFPPPYLDQDLDQMDL